MLDSAVLISYDNAQLWHAYTAALELYPKRPCQQLLLSLTYQTKSMSALTLQCSKVLQHQVLLLGSCTACSVMLFTA